MTTYIIMYGNGFSFKFDAASDEKAIDYTIEQQRSMVNLSSSFQSFNLYKIDSEIPRKYTLVKNS